MDFEARLKQANTRLKGAKVGVSICTIPGRDRLYLRATFPPRPGSRKTEPHQQRMPTGYRTNPAGLRMAEADAKVIGVQLERREFSWPIATVEPEILTAAEQVTQFEADYRRRGGSAETWHGDYQKIFRKLDLEQPLTSEAILAAIAATKENSKTRKRACMALGALAKFAGLEIDLKPLAGRYGPQSVQPRDLPDDALIAEWFDRLTNPAWQWVYGIMATYGLRNHEVFHLDFERLRQGDRVIAVGENTKTGSRRVWACYPEWFDAFDLANVRLPNIDLNRSNEKIGNSVTDSLRERGLPFPPYALRHCWAVRTIEFGLDTALAAKQMGHSEQIHTITYHHWIGDRHHQRAYDALMMRSDRPQPPR